MYLKANLKMLGSEDLNVSIDSIQLDDGVLILLGSRGKSPLKLKVLYGPKDDTQEARVSLETLRNIMRLCFAVGNYSESQPLTLVWDMR